MDRYERGVLPAALAPLQPSMPLWPSGRHRPQSASKPTLICGGSAVRARASERPCLVMASWTGYDQGIEIWPTTELLRFTMPMHGRPPKHRYSAVNPLMRNNIIYQQQGQERIMATGTVKWYNETKGYGF